MTNLFNIGGLNGKNLDNLQNDNIYVENSVIKLESSLGIPTRRGIEQGIISNGKLVNVVSNGYGHLPNDLFFKEVERKLAVAGVNYVTRSINRNDCSFAVDYILQDEKFVVNVKNGTDKIMPMLRFVNSYDGSNKTSGHFGFFRQVCDNGLHVAESSIGFSVKHRGNIVEVVLPEIGYLVNTFMENEYYTINRRFEILAEKRIEHINTFVKNVAENVKLFKFEASEKNSNPSLNARIVIETIENESKLLGVEPNFWLGYNAFNELLHTKLKKSFEQQKNIDARLFDAVIEMA
jgi:hypothetical protein